MRRLPLAVLKRRHPRDLSGGRRQRVAIARAFVRDLIAAIPAFRDPNRTEPSR